MTTRARDGGPLGREIEHTADLGLEVEAPTLALLFERAGLAVLGFAFDLGTVEPRRRLAVELAASGLAELLHDWLQTLIVRAQTAELVVCEIEVTHVDAHGVRATVGGEPLDRTRHRVLTELKGVTYHQLAVHPRAGGWWARVILDV